MSRAQQHNRVGITQSVALTALVVMATISFGAPLARAADPGYRNEAAGVATAPSPAAIAGLPAFVDGAVGNAMRRDHIAGVDVAIVDASHVLLIKDYGIAGLKPARAMTTDTLTRIGSLSKTIVWVALMQLVEQHRIALDDPINRYLPPPLQVPDDGFAAPILVKHLMTHTAGFEDTILGHMIIDDPHREMPAATYLAHYRPRRVRPPGQIAVYSNYGAALAGMIVAQVSQMPWEVYAEQRILRPLGMRSATYREDIPRELATALHLPQPMDAGVAARLSEGFQWQDGRLEQAPREYITHFAPAGALAATPGDMALYMQAFLDPQRFADAGVLNQDSVRKMLTPSFSNAPGFGTIYHGLFQFPFPGQILAVGHDGDTRYQHAIMLVVPSMQLGIFVGVNTGTGLRLIEELPYLVGEYLQGNPPRPENAATSARSVRSDVTGTYRSLRRAYYRSERAFLDLSETSVEQAANGDLLITGLEPDLVRYTPETGDTYREVAGPQRITFREERGRLLLLDPTGSNPLERIGFFAGTQWFLIILVLANLLALGGTVQAVRDLCARDRVSWTAAWAIVPCLWLAAFIVAWIGVAPWLASFAALVTLYPGFVFPLACWMFLVAALVTAGAVLCLVIRRPPWRAARWLFTSVTAVVFLSCAATFYYWGLLGFSGW